MAQPHKLLYCCNSGSNMGKAVAFVVKAKSRGSCDLFLYMKFLFKLWGIKR